MAFADFIESFGSLGMTDCDVRDLSLDHGDVGAVFMVSTSEHLDDPQECFAAIASLITSDGRMFVNHHNYYSWNGHHQPPWRVRDIDLNSPLHLANIDWAHLRHRVRNPDSPNYLNYLRMHELIEVVSQFFVIDGKIAVRFGSDTGEGRLTQTILDEFPCYYREELETIELHLLARKRTDRGGFPEPLEHCVEHRCSIEIAWQRREIGSAFITRVPSIGKLSGLALFEDDHPLGPRAAMHDQIRSIGLVLTVSGGTIYISTSDNTDPAVNGRKYVHKNE